MNRRLTAGLLFTVAIASLLIARTVDDGTDSSYVDLEHDGGIVNASFSPDGNYIAASNGSCTLYIWEVSSREKIAERNLCNDTELTTLGWVYYSTGGDIIVTEYYSGEGDSYFVHGVTGNIIRRVNGYVYPFTRIDFSSDNTQFVSGGRANTVQIRDVSNDNIIANLIGHKNVVTASEFSPDNTIIATSSFDNSGKIWNKITGEVLTELIGHEDNVMSISFSPDGTRVVTSSYDGTARVWDVVSGDEVLALAPIGRVNGRGVNAEYSPDGEYIVTGDWFTGIIKIWNANNGELIQSFEHSTGYLQALEFSPDGSLILSVSEGTIRLWEFDPE